MFESLFSGELGEIQVINNILDVVEKKEKWCVEFGAANGKFLSNTHDLIKNRNYSAVLIEPNNILFDQLKDYYQDNQKVITLNKFVEVDGYNMLDSILEEFNIPSDFDFLSIDIDGNDYHIWNSIKKYQPKIVCIEYNPTIPNEVRFVQPLDFNINQSSSLLSLVELGKRKGYELVSAFWDNAIFVQSGYFDLFGIQDNSPACLRKNLDSITYLFSGLDGKIFLHGNKTLPWHGIELQQSK